jgi:hypothetical protein
VSQRQHPDLVNIGAMKTLSQDRLSEGIALKLHSRVSTNPRSTFQTQGFDELFDEGCQQRMLLQCPYWVTAREASLWAPWLYPRRGQIGVPVSSKAAAAETASADTLAEQQQQHGAASPGTPLLFVVNAALVASDDLREFCAYTKMPTGAKPSKNIAQTNGHKLYSNGKWTTVNTRASMQLLDEASDRLGYRDPVWFNIEDVVNASLGPAKSVSLRTSCAEHRAQVAEVLQPAEASSPSSSRTPGWILEECLSSNCINYNVFQLHQASVTHYYSLSQLVFF